MVANIIIAATGEQMRERAGAAARMLAWWSSGVAVPGLIRGVPGSCARACRGMCTMCQGVPGFVPGQGE
jgi:hypothetical protein